MWRLLTLQGKVHMEVDLGWRTKTAIYFPLLLLFFFLLCLTFICIALPEWCRHSANMTLMQLGIGSVVKVLAKASSLAEILSGLGGWMWSEPPLNPAWIRLGLMSQKREKPDVKEMSSRSHLQGWALKSCNCILIHTSISPIKDSDGTMDLDTETYDSAIWMARVGTSGCWLHCTANLQHQSAPGRLSSETWVSTQQFEQGLGTRHRGRDLEVWLKSRT